MLDMKSIISKDKRCWTAEKASEWYGRIRQPFGCNFLPSSAVNSIEMFQSRSFDRDTICKEISLCAQTGYNCVRVFLPYVVYRQEKDSFLNNLRWFIEVLKESSLKIVPVLFDDCGKEPVYGAQASPEPLVHNGVWACSPDKEQRLCDFPQYKEYVQTIVSAYAHDESVLFWDLYNEPGNGGRKSKSFYLLQKAFEWAREAVPDQPLTACVWGMGFVDDEEIVKMDLYSLENSDILTFHQYCDDKKLKNYIDSLKELGYPVVCTEWMARNFNSTFSNCLPVFAKEKVGCINWGLVNGRTQTHIPWGYDRSQGEPKLWFHDLFRQDYSPYDEKEIETIKKFVSGL